MIDIECVVDAKALLGEGTYWDPRGRFSGGSTSMAPAIHRFDPATGEDDTWTAPEYLGCLAVRESGGLVVSMASGFYFFDPRSGAFEAIVDPETELADTPLQRRQDRPPRPLLVRHACSRRRASRAEDRARSTGSIPTSPAIGWSRGSAARTGSPGAPTAGPCITPTAIPTGLGLGLRSGRAATSRTAACSSTSADGRLVDGATVDADGCYWLTVPFKGKVSRYDPQGKLMRDDRRARRTFRPAASSAARISTRSTSPSATLRRVAGGAKRSAAAGRPLRHRWPRREGAAARAVQGVTAHLFRRPAPSASGRSNNSGFERQAEARSVERKDLRHRRPPAAHRRSRVYQPVK